MYIIQKLLKLYYSNVITVMFLPAILNIQHALPMFVLTLCHILNLKHRRRLLLYCHLALNLPHWIRQFLKTIFWSYSPVLLSKLLKSIPLLLMLMTFLFCHSMSKHDCHHSAKHHNAYGYDLWMTSYRPSTVSFKPVAQMKYNVASCITSVPFSIVTSVAVHIIITTTTIIVNMQYNMCHWSPFLL